MQQTQRYSDFIAARKAEQIHRKLQTYDAGYLDFSSNDYLGLSRNGDVIEEGIKAAYVYGAGSTGSRLLSGNKLIFEEFESIIANDKKTESSLIFNSGFQANAGVIDCLADKDTLVVFDKLNHASMYQGVFASSAKLVRYNHLDYDHLESILKNSNARDVIIASETVFGMDGDFADMRALIDLSDKFGVLLYLDEAHATGLYGYQGYGLSTDFEFDQQRTVIMGTFSKALGSFGAYVACSTLIKNYIIQKCRSFIYATAIPPFCIGASMAAWKMLKSLEEVRKDLLAAAEDLRRQLTASGLDVNGSGSNIIPIMCDNVESMIMMKERCLSSGIIVSGITRPTVPTPRIRIAITAHHSRDDIERLRMALS
ncbi:MAG: 8-amino-7-oxononanoate synthase [Holosporales bacterium]|jgi:8-amino-7-oxononanoate synthase|nr:8-amino-7-oxononanoate synthase [Holosporales bacterium]